MEKERETCEEARGIGRAGGQRRETRRGMGRWKGAGDRGGETGEEIEEDKTVMFAWQDVTPARRRAVDRGGEHRNRRWKE